MWIHSDIGLMLERQQSNLVTVANLPLVVNSVDKPNKLKVRLSKLGLLMTQVIIQGNLMEKNVFLS